MVLNALDMNNGSITEIRKARIAQLIERFGRHEMDCASLPIKAALLCETVMGTVDHLRANHKDTVSLRKL